MKKLFALLVSAVMLLTCAAVLAEAPEGYPEVKEGIDFGGQTIYIYDYWSASSERAADPTDEQQAQYDYRDWIEATYNCKVVQIAKGDWGSNATELANFVAAPDGTLCVFILPPDFVGGLLGNNALAAWNNDKINLEDELWNKFTLNNYTSVDGKVYGVSTGVTEPRQCLYFNKRVLEEAGIDWNTIYDMQADGTWTWEAFEDMLKKIQKDTDSDGITDIWGMTGSNVDMYRVAVFNNGGKFFDYDESGKMIIAVNDNTLEAMQWAKDTWNTYGYQQPADGSWDYYKAAWKQGFCGFYMYQTYGGFNDNSEMADMADQWGCVFFPKGPKGDTYYHIASENVTVLPNVYDKETAANITYIYSLWMSPTPGYEEDNWIGNKYNYTDERAVDETYAMMREVEHTAFDPVYSLGSVNDVEGADFLWNLGGSTPAELVEAKTPSWQGLLDAYNARASFTFTSK